MQISRRVLIACVSAGFLTSAVLPAADTEAQIKAREALERALRGGQPASTPQPVMPSTPQTPARPTVPTQPITSSPTTPQVVTPSAPSAASPDQIERARQALRQQLQQGTPATPTQPQQPAVARPTPAPTTPAPTVQPLPTVPSQPLRTVTTQTDVPAPAGATSEQIERARQALRQQLQGQPAGTTTAVTTPSTSAQTTPAPTWTAPAVATTPAPSMRAAGSEDASSAVFAPLPTESNPETIAKAREALQRTMAESSAVVTAPTQRQRIRLREPGEFRPIQGPPTGLPETKEEQLKELLDRYMADEVTPEQYHAERRKILAQP